MVSYKEFMADGQTGRFLIDFYIQNEEYTRPYAYKYDNSLPMDGSGDHLEDPLNSWSYPNNLWVRGGLVAEIEDLVPSEHWDVVDNSILFYKNPDKDTTIYVEVATRAEELGTTLLYGDVNIAKLSAVIAYREALKAKDYANDSYEDSLDSFTYSINAFKWASENFNVPVDDGIRQGYSSYHWARMAESYANGLQIEGVWNPNTDTFTPPQPGTLEDGMYWIVSEDSLAPIYGEDWLEGDSLVYLASMTPDPYVKQYRTIHWNNIQGKPVNFVNEVEITANDGDDTFNINYTPGNVVVRQNGSVLAPSDYTEGTNSVTLNVPAKQDDTIHLTGIEFINTDTDVEVYYNAQSRVLTADSYATEVEDTPVKDYISNGDGTYTPIDTSDFSSLHHSVKSYKEKMQSEAEQLTANSWANEPEDTFVKDYYYDEASDSILYNDTTFYSAHHWSEKAKLVASGLQFVGTWDASGGTYPPDGDTTGQFYIVDVSGDISGETYNVGDWIIWDNDSATWSGVHWLFSWAITQDVTVEGNAPAIGDDLARAGTSYTKAESDEIFTPIGGIIMYSGDGSSLGANWAICDGNNGTPNLVDKFIKGSSADLSDVGNTGGSADAVVVSHNHTFTGDLMPEHDHVLKGSGHQTYSNGVSTLGNPNSDGGSTALQSASAGTPTGTK